MKEKERFQFSSRHSLFKLIKMYPAEALKACMFTSRIVRVCDIIWMLTCDWLVGRLSLDRERTSCLEPLHTDLLFNSISVFMNTRVIYEELKEDESISESSFKFTSELFTLKPEY